MSFVQSKGGETIEKLSEGALKYLKGGAAVGE